MDFIARHRWWISRLLVLPLHLLLFTVITFVLVRSVPGDPVRGFLGQNATQEDYERMKVALGLDGSLTTQLGRYFSDLARADLGSSLTTGNSLWQDFLTRLPPTVELALITMTFTILLSLILSYVAVMHPTSAPSRVIRVYARTAGALPEYVLGVAALFIFYATLNWAPAPLGLLDSRIPPPQAFTRMPLLDAIIGGNWEAAGSIIRHLVLPVGVLVLANSPILIKLLISSLETAIKAPPTVFRIASGNDNRTVLLSVYRRAAPAAVTMCGTLFGYILGGAVVLEYLFGLTGMGSYAVTAVTTSDYPAIQGVLIVVAAMLLLVFLVVDLCNMSIDPRRRPGVDSEAR